MSAPPAVIGCVASATIVARESASKLCRKRLCDEQRFNSVLTALRVRQGLVYYKYRWYNIDMRDLLSVLFTCMKSMFCKSILARILSLWVRRNLAVHGVDAKPLVFTVVRTPRSLPARPRARTRPPPRRPRPARSKPHTWDAGQRVVATAAGVPNWRFGSRTAPPNSSSSWPLSIANLSYI